MPSKKPAATKAKTPAKSAKRNLSTFKADHDPKVIIPGKIRKALEAMAKEGGEVYAYENADKYGQPTFAERSGVSAQHLSQHRRAFADHIVKVKQDIGSRRSAKFVWFGTTKAATEARGGPVNPDDFE